MNKKKHISIRIDGELLQKFHHVSKYEDRSANSQIIQLMLKFISEYEKEHGKIEISAEGKK